ncbi:glycosyltransferase [Botrimarina mediterranea]|uniref:MurG-like transferase n=1 Tax=Botrimarina mediterranea TaxID=2528022 RepID=A0A518K929_9BACT|nr:hypothetical protein [Botrimarina mediterranea]QDV74299.1 hypothetical protein Spa11_25000 [Botrimarina mediterranea]
MSRFLLAWELGGALGHLATLRELATLLLERRHDVALALSDCDLADQFFPGLEVQTAPIHRPLRGVIAQPSTYADVLGNAGWNAIETLGPLCSAWRDLFNHSGAEVVVGNFAPTALLAAQGMDLRSVVFGTGFHSPPDISPLPDMCPWRDNYADRLLITERQVLATTNRQLASQGVEELERITELYRRADASLLTTFLEMDHYPDRVGGEYVGPWGELPGNAPVWPKGSGPRVFAYLKPIEALPYLLQHVHQVGWPTLVYAPGAKESAAPLARPTIHVVDRPLDMKRVAATCNFAVLNAGHNATLRILLAGKPALVLPTTGEQQLVAQRVERTGSGLAVHPNHPAAAVACLNRLASDHSYADAASRFATRYESIDLADLREQTADRLEEIAIRNE